MGKRFPLYARFPAHAYRRRTHSLSSKPPRSFSAADLQLLKAPQGQGAAIPYHRAVLPTGRKIPLLYNHLRFLHLSGTGHGQRGRTDSFTIELVKLWEDLLYKAVLNKRIYHEEMAARKRDLKEILAEEGIWPIEKKLLKGA